MSAGLSGEIKEINTPFLESKLSAFTKKGLPLTSNTQQPQSSQKLFRTTVTSKKTTYTFDLDVNEIE